jgi:rSAM/selenodomain-associated transferase 1
MEENALIIFAKPFIYGKVKTRLAEKIGNDKALKAYRELCLLTSISVMELKMPKFVFWHEEIPDDTFPFDKRFIHKTQSKGDLGNKMYYAFREILEKYKNVCIIGTDCPYLTKEILEESFFSLKNGFGYCIGPCYDGGYYLLGIKDNPEIWFQSIKWSTEEVYQKTIEIGDRENLERHTLPRLMDIDTWEDYKKWKKVPF